MSCCTNSRYQKSAQAGYNTATQTYVADGTQISVLGTQNVDTGISLTMQTGGFQINNGGLFRVSYDVTSTPSAAGTQTIQLYQSGIAILGADVVDTVAESDTITQHVEAILQINTCQAVTPIVSAQISGVAGSITSVYASMVKLA